MHYVMDDLEVDFLLDAVDFVASHGSLFLHLYNFDLYDGSWSKTDDPSHLQRFSLEAALEAGMGPETPMSFEERQKNYIGYLEEAEKLAAKLQKKDPSVDHVLEGTLGKLQFFSLPGCCMQAGNKKPVKGFVGRIKSIFKNK